MKSMVFMRINKPSQRSLPAFVVAIAWALIGPSPVHNNVVQTMITRWVTNMGNVNFFIVIYQPLTATTLTFLISNVSKQRAYDALKLIGVSIILQAFFVLRTNTHEVSSTTGEHCA